jgi:hypothetical protein
METSTAVSTQVEQIDGSESVFSIKAFAHAQRVAIMLSQSNLIPKEYQGNVQNTMIALEMANRIGASPLMVMQNLYIVHGKPSWSSTFIIAALNSCGRFSPLRFEIGGDGDDYGCTAWTYGKEGEKLIGPKVTLKMVKAEGWLDRAGSKWKTMPDLMFRYRSAAFFGRLYAPDILMGMHAMEEVIDMDPVILPEQITKEELTALFEEKRAILTESELNRIQEIIDNEEKPSYKKAKEILTSKA